MCIYIYILYMYGRMYIHRHIYVNTHCKNIFGVWVFHIGDCSNCLPVAFPPRKDPSMVKATTS